jgi:trehalose 6-phosphate phosphatase
MADVGIESAPPLLQAHAALYLDFDGTLAALAPHPDGVIVDGSLPALLVGLRERLAGAVALVTGRSLAALDAITGLSGFAAAGLHGHEWRLASGQSVSAEDPVGASLIVRALRERFGADARLVIEDKGAAVALHYRRAPERAQECIAAMRELVTSPDFEILKGHLVVEARPRGADKGAALRALAAHAPFAGRRPVFVGDDVTDEDGFRAAAALGGHGVKVGAGPSAARYRIAAVAEVRGWLAASLASLGAENRR